MHAVTGRLELVEELALRVEGRLARRHAPVLEQVARADELQKLVADVPIGAADIVDVESAVGPLVAEHEGAGRNARDGVGDLIVREPEGPKKSSACHRSRPSDIR